MYVRCPACRFVVLVEEARGPWDRCRRCGGAMKELGATLPAVTRTPKPNRVREEDLDLAEPVREPVSVEDGREANRWIREIFGGLASEKINQDATQ